MTAMPRSGLLSWEHLKITSGQQKIKSIENESLEKAEGQYAQVS